MPTWEHASFAPASRRHCPFHSPHLPTSHDRPCATVTRPTIPLVKRCTVQDGLRHDVQDVASSTLNGITENSWARARGTPASWLGGHRHARPSRTHARRTKRHPGTHSQLLAGELGTKQYNLFHASQPCSLCASNIQKVAFQKLYLSIRLMHFATEKNTFILKNHIESILYNSTQLTSYCYVAIRKVVVV